MRPRSRSKACERALVTAARAADQARTTLHRSDVVVAAADVVAAAVVAADVVALQLLAVEVDVSLEEFLKK